MSVVDKGGWGGGGKSASTSFSWTDRNGSFKKMIKIMNYCKQLKSLKEKILAFIFRMEEHATAMYKDLRSL